MQKLTLFFIAIVFSKLSIYAQTDYSSQNILTQGSLKIQVNQCKTIGNQLRIYFSATNIESDSELVLIPVKSRIIDSEGNVYKVKKAEFGSKKGAGTSTLKIQSVKDLPLIGCFIFEDGANDIEKIAVLQLTVRDNPGRETYEFSFKDLIIEKQNLSNLKEWFEFDKGLFCKIKNIDQQGSKIIATLLLKSEDSDSDYRLHFSKHRIIDDEGNVFKSTGGRIGKKKSAAHGGISTKLIKSVPVKAIVEFDTKSSNKIKTLSLLELHLAFANYFQFKGIDLQ